MKTTATALAIMALAATPLMAQTEATPPSGPAASGQPAQTTIVRPTGGTCLPASIAEGRDIVVLAAGRGGGGNVPFAIGETSEPATLVSVTGGSGRDVVLILSGGSSILWDVRGVAKGRVKAVLAHGSSAQAVIGVTEGMQTEFLDGRSRVAAMMAGGTCTPLMRASDLGDLRTTQKTIATRFGVTPSRLYASSSPAVLDVDGATVTAPEKVDVKPQDVKSAVPIDPTALMPGAWGMRQLVSQGYARPFTQGDVMRWKSAGGRISRDGGSDVENSPQYADLDPRMRERLMEMRERRAMQYAEPRSGYVLVRSVPALPRGFQPNPSTALVIPEGVDAPVGMMRPDGDFRYRLAGVELATLADMPTGTTEGEDSPMVDQRAGSTTPVELAVTWQKDGALVRFPTDATSNDAVRNRESAADTSPSSTSSSGVGWILAILVIAALGGGAFVLLRRRPDLLARLKSGTGTKGGHAKTRPESEDEVTMLLTRLEGLVPGGALLTELSDFRHQVSRLAVREDLEDDLVAECEQIVDRRFVEVARRYVRARPSADGDAATQLDKALQETLVEMSRRLSEIHDVQNVRNVEAMRQPSRQAPPTR